MSLRPTVPCTVRPSVGVDMYGKELLGEAFPAKCAIVRLVDASERTSVRTDSSASRGRAREIQSDARLLFPPGSTVKIDDQVELLGSTLKITSVFPRYDVQGRFHHYQVDGMIWA